MLLIATLIMTAQMELPPSDEVLYANDELKAYLVEAAENHPALHEKHERWLAALERVPQVTSLDDPMFTFGGFLLSTANRFKFSVAQKFPWFGTLRVRGEVAMSEAEAAFAELLAERDRIYLRVKEAYFEYVYLRDQIAVLESQQDILSYVEEIVSVRYSVAFGRQDDLLRIQIEEEKLRDRLESLQEMRPAVVAALAESLGRRPNVELPWPQEVGLPPVPPMAPKVFDLVRENNPQLLVWVHRIESADSQIELARKKGFPDFTFMLDYTTVSQPRQMRPDRPYPASLAGGRRLGQTATGQIPVDLIARSIDAYALAYGDEPMRYSDGGEDNFMVSVRINIPLWRDKVRAGVREARHRKGSMEYGYERAAIAIERDAQMALYRLEDSMRQYLLFNQSLLPKASQSYESLQAQYASGDWELNFIDVLDGIRELLDLDLAVVGIERNIHIAAARLEFLMGASWDHGEYPLPAADSEVTEVPASAP